MKFKKDELLSLAEFIGDLYTDGFEFVCYPRDRELYKSSDIYACIDRKVAQEHAALNGDWFIEPMGPFVRNLVQTIRDRELPEIVETGHYYYLHNEKTMNKNNLENLQGEMRALKFDEKLIEQMQKEMEKGKPGFTLTTQLPADNGQLDVTLNFKQSGSSDYYFLNRYDLALSKAKPLEEGKQYFVISPNPEEKGKNLSRKFDSAIQAIDYFKSQKSVSELAVGKSVADKMTLATMDKGKVDYVTKEFRTAYYSPVITNSQFVDRGRGFNVVQAANMLQGRAAYRDDLVNRSGESYKAWNVHQFDEAKDKYGNYKVKQYSEGYGFDVKKELDSYAIKELADPKKMAAILEQMKDGGRPVVTVIGQDGQEQKLRVEAMPRFTNINFHQLNGKIEKREQFLKDPSQDLGKGKANVFEKKMNQGQEQGMSI